MNNLNIITAITSLFLIGNFAFADLKALSDEELSQVSATSTLDLAAKLRSDLKIYAQTLDQNISEDQVKQFLQDRANLFGLSLNNILIEGITFDENTSLILQLDGVTVSTQQLPSHIDRIYVPSVTVTGSNPNNKSFGSLEARDINLSGTRIIINSSSIPGAPRAIPQFNK